MPPILLSLVLAAAAQSPAPTAHTAGTPVAQAAATERPNLLLVVTDDQRFDQLGCAGHPVLQTPNMDALAARGVSFTQSFVTTPICAASRASLMTGRREGRHGYTFGRPPMGPELIGETYFSLLRTAGYRTGFFGKWGVKMAAGARAELFDSFHSMGAPYLRKEKAHLTTRTADAAIQFLAKDDGEQPFCLTVSFNAPHAEDPHPDQYIPPTDLADLYSDAEVALPPLAESGFAALPDFLQSSLGRVRWAWRFDNDEKRVKRTKDYWRMISGVDRALGRILAQLEEQGLADNTVVIFTSDNGYFLGERGLAGKWLIYEESIRVPLVIYDPRVDRARAGSQVKAMVANIDLAPSLLDWAGVPIPAAYGGSSLKPWVQGSSPEWRQDLLIEHAMDHDQIPANVGLRGERWVYSRYYREEPAYEQLFDLQTDPDQLINLATDPAHREQLLACRKRCAELDGDTPR